MWGVLQWMLFLFFSYLIKMTIFVFVLHWPFQTPASPWMSKIIGIHERRRKNCSKSEACVHLSQMNLNPKVYIFFNSIWYHEVSVNIMQWLWFSNTHTHTHTHTRWSHLPSAGLCKWVRSPSQCDSVHGLSPSGLRWFESIFSPWLVKS